LAAQLAGQEGGTTLEIGERDGLVAEVVENVLLA
jgi:hypothetical protein